MRTITSFLGLIEPENDPKKDQVNITIRLLGLYPTSLLYWYHYAHNKK